MKVYVVVECDFYNDWNNIKCFSNYEKAVNFVMSTMVPKTFGDDYEIEECLDLLKNYGYIEGIVGIDEMEVE